MVLHLIRILFLLVVMGLAISFGFQAARSAGTEEGTGPPHRLYVIALILIPVVAAFLLVLVDMLWRRKRLQVLSGLFFGSLAGLVIAYGLSVVVELVLNVFRISVELETLDAIKTLLGVAAVFLCVSFVLQTKDDFRFVIPYVEFARQTKGARPILLDTSVIIDGRIADIAETGFLEFQTIVPQFVLTELHALADSQDKLKRNRGRRGLDVLNQIRNSKRMEVQLLEAQVPAVERAAAVDEKLVALAEHLDGRIVTNDYNLNKIAKLRGVDVVNINELANALKPVMLPGEAMRVKILRPGEEPGQGVGYLEDGTMVVVEQGRDHIGAEVEITVTSVLQTAAGRMIFGKAESARATNARGGG